MGLDWNPMSRPKAGHEKELEQLFPELEASPTPELLEQFNAITEAPFTALGAPRVGHDAAADAWLAERLPECDGFPVYTHYGMYEGLDRYSFRGKFLDDVADVIGPELMELAYTKMLAPQLKDFGERLCQHARALAKKHGAEHVENVRDADFDPESLESNVHILFAAGRWCLYWAERGFGLEPWF